MDTLNSPTVNNVIKWQMKSKTSQIMKQHPNKQMMIACVAVFLLFQRSASSQNLSKEFVSVVGRSNYIFVGTVMLTDSSNVNVHSSRKSAIIRVDDVLDAAVQYSLMADKLVTMFFADSSTHTNGKQSVFYTKVSSVGRTLGLTEVRNSLDKEVQTDLKQRIMKARDLLADDTLRAQLKRSELVVLGSVVNPRSDTSKMYRIQSEHNPEVIGATIEIKRPLKGHVGEKKILVYYASSDDALWYRSAKLSQRMDRIFLLHSTSKMPIFPSSGYAVLDPRDVQSTDQLNKILQLLKK
jgi:hypothetical protein